MRKALVFVIVLTLFVIGAAVAAKPQPARVPCGIVVTIVCKVQAFPYPTFAPVKQQMTCKIAAIEYVCKPKQPRVSWIIKYDSGISWNKR